MKFIHLLPAVALTLLQPTISNALSPTQIQSIAKSVTDTAVKLFPDSDLAVAANFRSIEPKLFSHQQLKPK